MPRLTIIADPVFAHPIDPDGWWGSHGAVSVVVSEYHKYLAAWVRPLLDRVLPPPPALPPVIRSTASGTPPQLPSSGPAGA